MCAEAQDELIGADAEARRAGGKPPARRVAHASRAPGGPSPGPDAESLTLTSFLEAMPALTRWTNMDLLDERSAARRRPTTRTLLVVVAHGLITAMHLAHLLLMSKGDRVYNDAGAFIAAQVTWSYLLQALLQRRTLRRLYAEMLEYSKFVEASSPARSSLQSLHGRLRRLWTTQSALTLGCWAFYTASPFLFEFIHDIELGSLRRLSAMVYPAPCDLDGLACYRVMYFAVAFEWFLASLAFSSVECTNLVFYTVASKHFEVLGASFSQVFSGDDVQPQTGWQASSASSALRQCVLQHQFLVRWSKEMTEVYAVPTFIRLGAMVLLFIMPLLKTTIVDNYVMDELPFVGIYGMLTIYAVCWVADDLNRASSQMHGRAYMSDWERGWPEQRRTLHILLTRCLRPVRTRAYWVDNVSLRTFVEVLNRSYSSLQTIRAARRKGAE